MQIKRRNENYFERTNTFLKMPSFNWVHRENGCVRVYLCENDKMLVEQLCSILWSNDVERENVENAREREREKYNWYHTTLTKATSSSSSAAAAAFKKMDNNDDLQPPNIMTTTQGKIRVIHWIRWCAFFVDSAAHFHNSFALNSQPPWSKVKRHIIRSNRLTSYTNT